MKKSICIFLSLIIVLSSLMFNVSASGTDSVVSFSYELYSTKPSYEKGEAIEVGAALKNNSLDEITDMRIWMDYPVTDYYLTPGATERFVENFKDNGDYKFRVSEEEGMLNFASKFDSIKVIKNLLLKLAHAYKSLTLVFTTIRYSFQNKFISFGQKKIELGTVKVLYDNTEIEFTLKCRYSVNKSEINEAKKLSNNSGMVIADVKAVKNSYTGLTFALGENEYGLFAMNPDFDKAYIYNVKDEKYDFVAVKSVDIEAGKFYQMKTVFESGRLICYLADEKNDTDPYPVFDLSYDSDGNGYGVYCKQDGYKNFTVSEYQIPNYDRTYTNPVYENAPDPYILNDDGTYYLYATTDSNNGFRVSSSTDLVNWKSLGFCAKKGEIFGNDRFWAPEVYNYSGKYYMLYSTDEHLALAVSDSPTGPFVKTQDNYFLDYHCIDGHFFFDDDGSVYLYMAYWGKTGEEIWGCRMKIDLSGIVPETLIQLTTCEKNDGGINEGPFMLKHGGKYFLTYSIHGYDDHNYSVKLAVSDSPLGTFDVKGIILEKSGPLVGTGHHAFVTSPDGNELFIAYHCHYSTTQVHGRKLCIDRCKFVETDDGYTISIYGPTSTPQPYPGS